MPPTFFPLEFDNSHPLHNFYISPEELFGDFQVALVVKNLPANAGDTGSIPGFGRSPGGEHGNLLQYSYLKNPMDRGAWQVTVHGSQKSQTLLATKQQPCQKI
ncbi:hypothetical protein R6Z07M_015727 [Ovis aries]